MTERFYLKKDDTRPKIRSILKDAAGLVVNVSGATVRFIMTPKTEAAGSTPTVDAVASIITAAEGIVEYTWEAADTDTVGKYRAEWEVTFSDGGRETFPNSEYIEVIIRNDLGGIV